MVFTPADGETARWRHVDDYIDAKILPGDLITFRDIQDLLDVDKQTAAGVIQQVRVQREKAGKPTLVTMRGAGWLLARPDQELEEDTRRHEHLLNAAEGRIRLLGSIQSRRSELTDEERHTLDFKQAQVAAQAAVLGSRRAPASDILRTAGSRPVPITAQHKQANGDGGPAARGLPVTDTRATAPAAQQLGSPAVTFTDIRPGPGDEHYRWLVVPSGRDAQRAAADLTARYDRLPAVDGLTLIPARRLHIPVSGAIPVSGLASRELAAMTGKVRDGCQQLSPFAVTAGPARVSPGGLACPVSPAAPLSDLEKITGDACMATGHQFPAGPEPPGAPSIVVAYTTAQVPDELPVMDHDDDITMQLNVVQLVRVRFDGPNVAWRVIETVHIGEP